MWRSPKLINDDSELEQRTKDFFETEPETGDVGVQVDNLKKVFKSLSGSTVKAVDGVSFKAYKGQITALLGHNGAGKSTTMNVLTGKVIFIRNSKILKTEGDTQRPSQSKITHLHQGINPNMIQNLQVVPSNRPIWFLFFE